MRLGAFLEQSAKIRDYDNLFSNSSLADTAHAGGAEGSGRHIAHYHDEHYANPRIRPEKNTSRTYQHLH